MCFTLHIAAGRELPSRPWCEDDRHVWLDQVDENAESVRAHFSLPHVAYLGSDLNCGCGFRSVSFQESGWPEECLIEQGALSTDGTQKNHRELGELLRTALVDAASVELYGCWDGDYAEKAEQVQELSVDSILSESFFFRERVLYRVRN